MTLPDQIDHRHEIPQLVMVKGPIRKIREVRLGLDAVFGPVTYVMFECGHSTTLVGDDWEAQNILLRCGACCAERAREGLGRTEL